MFKLSEWFRMAGVRGGSQGIAFDANRWSEMLEGMPPPWRLPPPMQRRLGALAERFLAQKRLDPVGGLALTPAMRWTLAAQACLPLLGQDLSLYDNWRTVILYPGDFFPAEPVLDEAGVEHAPGAHAGQSWPDGPVILSWDEIEAGLAVEDGLNNVVIHELAHQLDWRGGGFDGMPPLRGGMDPERWVRVFSEAYERLGRLADAEQWSVLDPYGAESPAEFFAVSCEAFFMGPVELEAEYPDLYGQLKAYFRQDPARWPVWVE